MGNYTVYMHTSPSAKRYVGITGTSIARRWNNGHGYSPQQYFYRAILKYGFDSFQHDILFRGLSKEAAELKEVELISLYKSNDPKFGYNIANGGHHAGMHSDASREKMSISRTGLKWSNESKMKASKSHTGKKNSEEHNKNIAVSKIGNTHGKGNKGKKYSAEICKKMGENRKGRKHSDDTKLMMSIARQGKKHTHAKAVMQFDLQGNFIRRFDYMSEAQKSFGYIQANISRCCKGERKTAHGFIWKYADREDMVG